MKQNKLNYLQSLRILGPSRPQDIITMDTESVRIIENKNNRAWILFTNSYYKCGNNHIFVNENFESFDGLTAYIEQIHPNSHVHIFLNTRGCDAMGLFAFCHRISQIECVKIIIHHSKECTINRYITDYFSKLGNIKIKLINETPTKDNDFWCTDWYDWQKNRVVYIHNDNYDIRLSGYRQPLTGICVKLDNAHAYTQQDSFNVFGISSNFISGFHHDRTDTFAMIQK